MTQPQPATNDILLAALQFLTNGINIVPARNDGSKAPAVAWQEYQHRMTTADEIIHWAMTAQGFGVITGAISGNLEMVELEGRAVNEGMLEEVKHIAIESGMGDIWDKFSQTYIEKTPSGGVHWLYRISDGTVPGNTKLARRPGENGGEEVLAETRGEGGFCIVAPSGGTVHPSGNSWEMISGDRNNIVELTMQERQQLMIIFRSLDMMPAKETIAEVVKPKTTSEELTPGDDYNQRAAWEEILTGWTKVFTANGVTYWRRPGKDIGISATTGRNDGDNLYVFTTSTSFEAEKPYSKFAAYTHLNFNGDYSQAAKTLRQNGYGSISVVQNVSPLQRLEQSIQRLETPMPQIDPETGEIIDDFESSWKPVDLMPLINGTAIVVLPKLLRRNDGVALLYSGKIHSFYGESESGKSWLAQWAAAEQLEEGKDVLYVDFESDAADLIERLKFLGVSTANIRDHFTYIKPETSPHETDPYWQDILAHSYALCVIDGVTEALTIWGGETKDNDLITLWTRKFPRRIAKETGAAVVTIDHVAKDKETRGRFAIGGQAKLAALDGAAFLIEPADVLAPGMVGRIVVRVTKDRPGQVRKHAGEYRKKDRTQGVAEVVFDSTGSQMKVGMYAVDTAEEALEKRREIDVTEVVKAVKNNPGCTMTDLTKVIKRRTETIQESVTAAIENGMIEVRVEGRRHCHYLTEMGGNELFA